MRRSGRILLLALALAAAVAAAVALLGYGEYRRAVDETPIAERVEEVRSREGYVALDRLPRTYLRAVVAAEDHRFYRHGGVDPIAIARAAANDIRSGSLREGGSTITQQLAKALCFSDDKTFTRKAAEAFAAMELERLYGKDEILELYVNVIYFGNGCYGVGSASRAYYGCEPAALTYEQCVMLAGIPNAPSVYNPLENPGLARERQAYVERQLERYGGEIPI